MKYCIRSSDKTPEGALPITRWYPQCQGNGTLSGAMEDQTKAIGALKYETLRFPSVEGWRLIRGPTINKRPELEFVIMGL